MRARIVPAAVVWILAPLALAQVQLQFAGSGATYSHALALPNGETLLVGTNLIPPNIALLANPAQRMRIILATTGPVPFASAPSSLLPQLGGHGSNIPRAAAIDPKGNIWIAGTTDSDDFDLVNPIVSHKVPYRTVAFVLELDPTGTNLLFSTYLAGQTPAGSSCLNCPYATYATAIAIDAIGNVYVGGSTNERDFPTTPGAFLSNGRGGADVFGNTVFFSWIAKLSAAGKLVYSTLVETGSSNCSGGSACIGNSSASASISSMAVDTSGMVTLAGVKSGSFNPGAGYVAHLSADGSKLLWSTAVGANYGWVRGLLMAQDSSGNIDLFGLYAGVLFRPSGVVPVSIGATGLFAEKLSPDGSTVISSIDLGPSPDANIAGIAVDASGSVYLAGTSSSAQFPALLGVPNLGSDFILGLNSSGTKPDFLLRFPRGTVAGTLSLNATGRILVPGTNSVLTISRDKPLMTQGIVAIANAASYALNTGVLPGELISVFGFDFGDNPQVLFDGTPGKIVYAGVNQINVQVPFDLPFGGVRQNMRVVSSTGSVEVNDTPISQSIGIFTTDGVHAAALNQDGTVNSASNPAGRGSIVTLFGTGTYWPRGILNGAIAESALSINPLNGFLMVDATGHAANILYAGAAPGLIYGVFQLNVQLPLTPIFELTLVQLTGSPIWTSPTSNPVQIYIR